MSNGLTKISRNLLGIVAVRIEIIVPGKFAENFFESLLRNEGASSVSPATSPTMYKKINTAI